MSHPDPETVGLEAGAELKRPLGSKHHLHVWLAGEFKTWNLPSAGELIVGRAPEAEVSLELLSVSRRHACLSVEPERVTLTDLGSHNGTWVNGERLAGTRALAYGDALTFGDVRAMFSGDDGTSSLEANDGAELQVQVLELGDRRALVADPVVARVYTELSRLARADLTVLVLGETGAGKDLAAAALHYWSRRFAGPFVTINCAALPEQLVESELFGYERGAFSGAVGAKPGMLEAADKGTLFLDEVGDLPMPIQAKLLRALERGRLTRLGSVRERTVDVRLVAATNRDLMEGIGAGWFREDLYHRLTAAVVKLPPLRLRPREIPLLAGEFLAAAAAKLGRAPIGLSPAALDVLGAYHWPGNVRELKNVMDYLAAAVTGDLVGAGDLPPRLTEPAAPGTAAPATSDAIKPLGESNRAFERQTLVTALARTQGNRTRAAKLLGIPLRTFMDKIRRHGVT